MKTAVIETGGKQHLVKEGDSVVIEKIAARPDETFEFKKVLLTTTGKTIKVGTPHIAGASVEATVVNHGQGKKIFGVKMKPKKRYRKLFGHRQHYTEIKVTKIKTR